MKKMISILLAVLLLAALAGCGGQNTADKVELREMMSSLMVTENELGLAGTYETMKDITDGAVDPALIGTWQRADGAMTFTFHEDGTLAVDTKISDSATELEYTCLTIEGRNILCEEVEVASYADDSDEPTVSKTMSYNSYNVKNDALYLVTVESIEDDITTSFQQALQILYRVDDTGSIDAAMAASPIDMNTYYGTWDSEKGSITIDETGLHLDDETYAASLDEKNRLVAEKDGVSTAYDIYLSYYKNYADASKMQVEDEGYQLNLYYTGADENDIPNLLSRLSDWKTEYGWEEWRYDGSFTLAK